MANYPKTPQELFESEWKAKIEYFVFNFHLNEPIEDTIGDIFFYLVKRDYLSKWNPKLGGSFPTYIFKFVENICLIKKHRSNTKGGLAIEGALSLTTSAEDEKGYTAPGTVDEGRLSIPASIDASNLSSYNSFVSAIEKLLSKPRYTAHSYGMWEGQEIPRSMLQVFRYIAYDYLDVREIAERFQTSQEFVYSLIRKMQGIIKQSHLYKPYDLGRYGRRVSK